jgi:hypothetical protein
MACVTPLTGDDFARTVSVRRLAGARPASRQEPAEWRVDVSDDNAVEIAEAARRARFGKLPDRIRPEDMTETRQASPHVGIGAAYSPEGSWQYFSCLALDLGL